MLELHLGLISSSVIKYVITCRLSPDIRYEDDITITEYQDPKVYFLPIWTISKWWICFLLDAIREMRKYSDEQEHSAEQHGGHLDTQIQMHMRLFRAQRNFYISGFALFLCLWV